MITNSDSEMSSVANLADFNGIRVIKIVIRVIIVIILYNSNKIVIRVIVIRVTMVIIIVIIVYNSNKCNNSYKIVIK